MSKFWHTFGSIGILVLTAASPTLQGLIGSAFMSHPAIAMGVATTWGVIGHLLPSPLTGPQNQ